MIKFKTKVRETVGGERYIELKKTLSRSDCTLKASDHTYYNSDLFPAMLNRAYKDAVNRRSWLKLDELPDSVHVDTSKFLAVVTINLPKNFR